MITIQINQGPVYATTAGGEIWLNAPGQWVVPDVTAVAFGTNAAVNVGELHDGAAILVDNAGNVRVSDGARIVDSVGAGFAFAVGTLGVLLVVTRIVRRFMTAAVNEVVE